MSRPRQQHTGIARHGRLTPARPVRTALAFVALSLAVILVSGVAVAGLAFWQFTSTVTANSIDLNGTDVPDAAPSIGSYETGFNILIVGVDNDSEQGGAYGERDSTLNDVNILVHVSADHTNAVVVSIPRDLIVAHPSCTDMNTGEEYSSMSARPVNEAMSRGGLPCVVTTIEKLTGLEIPFAGLASFDRVVRMSDAVGGVPICLSEAIDDPLADLNLPAGTSVVSGSTALAFLRSRHGVGDGSDLSRISSQQIYLASLMRTVQGDGTFTDLPKLFSLATAAATNIKLSTNLAHTDTMVSMALALKDIDLSRLVFVQYPGTTEDPNFPNKVVPLQDLADTMFAKILADEPFALAAADPEPSDEPTTETGTGTPVESDAPVVEAAPEVLGGLTGRTAEDQSCAQAFSG